MKTAPEGRRVSRLKSRLTRCLMVWVAALSLLPVLSSYVHLLLVQHSTCPEHGEIIDQPASATATTPVAGRPLRAHQTLQVAESDDAHRHSHCAFVLSRRQLFAPATAVSAHLAPPPAQPLSFPAHAPRPASRIALLRLAPKQSPPA